MIVAPLQSAALTATGMVCGDPGAGWDAGNDTLTPATTPSSVTEIAFAAVGEICT